MDEAAELTATGAGDRGWKVKGGGGDRRQRLCGETLLARVEGFQDETGDVLVLARLGGYACIAIACVPLGVIDPEAVAVGDVPVDDLLSSSGLESLDLDREADREIGRGSSTSRRGGSSSSSSVDARKSGSSSGSTPRSISSEGRATEVLYAPALTIESISQNCKMFMMIGKIPITLIPARQRE